jgi:hypothetical protein
MTAGQRLAVEQLHAVELAGSGVFKVVSVVHEGSRDEWLVVEGVLSVSVHDMT